MIWNEMFTRASLFLTVRSGSVVALALVSQATDFDDEFRILSLLILQVVLLVGSGTFRRVRSANNEDVGLVIGMNRLRSRLAVRAGPGAILRHRISRRLPRMPTVGTSWLCLYVARV